MMFTNGLIICILFIKSVVCYNTELIGTITVSHPGFLSLIKSKDTGHVNTDYDLFVSSFNGAPFTTDHVYHIPAIGNMIGTLKSHGSRLHLNTVASDIAWPNEINQIPGLHDFTLIWVNCQNDL